MFKEKFIPSFDMQSFNLRFFRKKIKKIKKPGMNLLQNLEGKSGRTLLVI